MTIQTGPFTSPVIKNTTPNSAMSPPRTNRINTIPEIYKVFVLLPKVGLAASWGPKRDAFP